MNNYCKVEWFVELYWKMWCDMVLNVIRVKKKCHWEWVGNFWWGPEILACWKSFPRWIEWAEHSEFVMGNMNRFWSNVSVRIDRGFFCGNFIWEIVEFLFNLNFWHANWVSWTLWILKREHVNLFFLEVFIGNTVNRNFFLVVTVMVKRLTLWSVGIVVKLKIMIKVNWMSWMI